MPKYSTTVALVAFAAIPAGAWGFTYVVKDSDNLSTISHKLIHGSVFGNNGSLKRILTFNPHIKNPDRIFPGENIKISGNQDIQSARNDEMTARSPAAVQLTQTSSKENVDLTLAPKETGSKFELSSNFSFSAISVQDKSSGNRLTLPSQTDAGATGTYFQN